MRVRAKGAGCKTCRRARRAAAPRSRKTMLGERPELEQEWDFELNRGVAAHSVAAGSVREYGWVCRACGGRWNAPVKNRVAGSGCPSHACRYARGGRVSSVPTLAAAWAPTNKLPASDVSLGSGLVAAWLCKKCGGRWEHTVAAIARGLPPLCPECRPRGLLVDEHPELAKQYSSANLVPLSEIKSMSGRRCHWRCQEHGHPWEATVNNRVARGSGCPECLERWERSIADVPELMQWWSPRNTDRASSVGASADRQPWWLCSLGHHFRAYPARMLNRGCPICSNHRVLAGFNDLATTHPVLALTWGPGNERTVFEVSAGSSYRAQWACSQGHTWRCPVAQRSGGTECPECINWGTSREEQKLAEALRDAGLVGAGPATLAVAWGTRRSAACDIVHQETRLVVEYDGAYWHRYKHDTDAIKTAALIDAGWAVVRVREQPLGMLEFSHSRLLQIHHTWGTSWDKSVESITSFTAPAREVRA